ncbi:MAG: proton-conducting transporter membrane subunit [Clostridia bacterium]
MDLMMYLAISFMAVPLLVILVVNLLPRAAAAKACIYFAGVAAVLQVAVAVSSFFILGASGQRTYAFALLWRMQPGTDTDSFAITHIALVLLLCIGMVSLVSTFIANRTITQRRIHYVNLLMTLMLGMNGMAISTDLFTLYVFMEITAVSSFIMIAMFKEDASLEGAFKYLVMSSVASIFILTGLSFLFMKAGSLRYSAMDMSALLAGSPSQSVLIYVAFILLLAGFCIKSGAVPFHSWLPDAHQSADTAISVLLSGVVIKAAGIYGLITITKLFGELPAIRLSLAVIGTVSIIAGALLALRQNHFKRILAYSSVSQMGYILLGLSAGSTLGLLGVTAHIFSHAMFKSTLFSNAAALHEQTGTLDINEMGGLQKKMPITSFSSVVAFLSTAGMPPFAGFWSKLLIIMALWLCGSHAFACIALVSSILTGAYFLRLQRKVFFGKLAPRYDALTEVSGSIRFAQIMLTAVTIGAGLTFPLLIVYLQNLGLI